MTRTNTDDPVERQANALIRLWGSGAHRVALRYHGDAAHLKQRERMKFWDEVAARVAKEATTNVRS